jgi:hypothetical protein
MCRECGDPNRYVKEFKASNAKTTHEMRRTAQAVTFGVEAYGLKFLDQDIGECLIRNLMGLAKADELQQPSLMNEFEWRPPLDIVPRDFLRVLVKDSSRNAKYKGKKTPPGGKPGQGKGGGNGKGSGGGGT